METVTIVLKLPPACLSPNKPPFSAGGRYAKAAAIKKQRRDARNAIEEERIESGPWEKVEAKAVFYHKTNRRRDGANFNAQLKGAFDGIVDAGLVVDDDHKHWTTLPPGFEIDNEFPRVEITITSI